MMSDIRSLPTEDVTVINRESISRWAPVPLRLIVGYGNPYWDRCGLTFEDPDGYRVVLQRENWDG